MPGPKRWLDLWAAVELVRKSLGVSIGAAQGALCEACASGMVRWRRGEPRYGISIEPAYPLTRDFWQAAHIDLEQGRVIRGHSQYCVEISNSDLAFWITEREKRDPAFREELHVYQSLTEVMDQFKDSDSTATVRDILALIADRCAKGHMHARARRRNYGSEQPERIADPIERRREAKIYSRLSGRFERISSTEWKDLSFDLDERQLPTGELLSGLNMRLAWASVEFCESGRNEALPNAVRQPTAAGGPVALADHSPGKQPHKRGAYVTDLKDFIINMGAERLRHLKLRDIARLYLDHRATRAAEGKLVPIVPADQRSIARQAEPIREDILAQEKRTGPTTIKQRR